MGEDDLAAVLRGVQIDIAHDAKVVVAILVGKDLVHVPHMIGLLVALVDGEHRGAAGVAVGEDFLVLLVIGVECLLPANLAHAPVLIELAQVADVPAGRKGHAAEERVAYQQRAAAAVCYDLVDALRRHGVECGRVAGVLPLVHQARVDRAHHKAQPRDDVAQTLVALFDGHGAIEGTIGLSQVAQQNALGAGDAELLDIALKVARALQHVAQDALGRELVVVGPGHFLAVLVEGGIEQVLERLFVGDILDAFQALLVLHAVGLHLGHGAIAGGTLLRAQHLFGVLERGLDHRDEVHGVGLTLGVEQLQRGEKERRKRLIERKVLGQVDRQRVVDVRRGVGRSVGRGRHLGAHDDAGVDERGEDLIGANLELRLFLRRLQARLDEVMHAGAGVAALLDHANHHGMRDAQARLKRLGLRLDQALKGLLVPGDKALGGLLLFNLAELLGVVARLGHELGVLDLVFRGLGDDHALGVEARAAGATGDLMELAGA